MLQPYRKNNIIFRIAAADAISAFKATQAHAFIQLSRKEISFNDAAKEVILLEYDRFSHWVLTLERIVISTYDRYIPDITKPLIFNLFIEELNTIESVMKSHPQVFTDQIRTLVNMVHRYSTDIMEKYIKRAVQLKTENAFTEIIVQVGNYLQHLLTCMHEYNNNVDIRTNPQFICVNDFCVVDPDNGLFDFGNVMKRADFFEAITRNNTFIFKNYSEKIHQGDIDMALSGFNLIDEDSQFSVLV